MYRIKNIFQRARNSASSVICTRRRITAHMPDNSVLCYSFSGALFVFLVLERVLHAICILLARLMWGRRWDGQVSHMGCPIFQLKYMDIIIPLPVEVNTVNYDWDVQDKASEMGQVLAAFMRINYSMILDAGDNAYIMLRETDYARTFFESGGSVKGYASMQMVGAGFTIISAVASAVASCIVSAITALMGRAVWAMVVSLIFALLYLIQENYSSLLLDAVDQWNAGYGPLVHKYLFIPLQVLDVMFSRIVPIYNGLVWFLRQIFQVITWSVWDMTRSALVVPSSPVTCNMH